MVSHAFEFSNAEVVAATEADYLALLAAEKPRPLERSQLLTPRSAVESQRNPAG